MYSQSTSSSSSPSSGSSSYRAVPLNEHEDELHGDANTGSNTTMITHNSVNRGQNGDTDRDIDMVESGRSGSHTSTRVAASSNTETRICGYRSPISTSSSISFTLGFLLASILMSFFFYVTPPAYLFTNEAPTHTHDYSALNPTSTHTPTRTPTPSSTPTLPHTHTETDSHPYYCRSTHLNILQNSSICTSPTSIYTPLYQSINTSLSFYNHNLTYHKILSSAVKCSLGERVGWVKCLTLQFYKGHIYIISYQPGFQTRQQSTLMFFYRLQELYRELLPSNLIMTIGSDDGDERYDLNKDHESGLKFPIFQFARREFIASMLIPDFNFITWPEADNHTHFEVMDQIISVRDSVHFKDKASRLFARFAPMGTFQRPALVNEGQKHRDTMDVKWIYFRDDPNRFNGADDIHGDIVPLHDHCRHKYLAVPDGLGYAGRYKYLVFCNSVIVKPPHRFFEFWTHLYKAGDTFIEHNPDGSDVHDKMVELMKNETRGEEIAKATAQIADTYLSPNAIDCYMITLLNRYSSECLDCPAADQMKLLPNAIPIERWIVSLTEVDHIVHDGITAAMTHHVEGEANADHPKEGDTEHHTYNYNDDEVLHAIVQSLTQHHNH